MSYSHGDLTPLPPPPHTHTHTHISVETDEYIMCFSLDSSCYVIAWEVESQLWYVSGQRYTETREVGGMSVQAA
jgi:hypothetical protein